MYTKFLMIGSAGYFAVIGLALTFLPQEINKILQIEEAASNVLVAQTLGAAMLAMAMINWMTRTNILGGIYGKPLTISNFLFFFISAMTYLKSNESMLVSVLAALCCGFAAWFGYITFTHPFKKP